MGGGLCVCYDSLITQQRSGQMAPSVTFQQFCYNHLAEVNHSLSLMIYLSLQLRKSHFILLKKGQHGTMCGPKQIAYFKSQFCLYL